MSLPRTVRIDVTAEDIANGVVSNDRCPIALAFRRAANTAFSVSVDSMRIDAEVPVRQDGAIAIGRIVMYCLPPEATAFVDAFDDGKDVEPFAFEVTAS